jgi:hypothetical protein
MLVADSAAAVARPDLAALLLELRETLLNAPPGAIVAARFRVDKAGRLERRVEITLTWYEEGKGDGT